MILNPKLAIAPVDAQGRYVPRVAYLRNKQASGVYGILRGSRWLYIGESHTGRLFDTLTRHFRQWKRNPKADTFGRRRGGTEYDRRAVRVVWVETAADEAEALQWAAIQHYRPADNDQQGRTAAAAIPAVSKHTTRFEVVSHDDDTPF